MAAADELPDLREHRDAQIKARREQVQERLLRLAACADIAASAVLAYLEVTLDPEFSDATVVGKIAAGVGFGVVSAITLPMLVVLGGIVCMVLFNLGRWIVRGDVEVDPWA